MNKVWELHLRENNPAHFDRAEAVRMQLEYFEIDSKAVRERLAELNVKILDESALSYSFLVELPEDFNSYKEVATMGGVELFVPYIEQIVEPE